MSGQVGAYERKFRMTMQDRDNPRPNRLLNGWKEIAGYFRRDESTVKRWAARKGMPVHRVPGHKRAAIHADTGELETWLKQQGSPARLEPAAPVEPPPVSHARRFAWRVAVACLAVIVLGTGAVMLWHGGVPAAQQAAPGRASPAEALYLDGHYYLQTRQADGLRRAIGLFTEAIARDPGYADAYTGLADAYNLISQYTAMPPEEAYPKARAAAERAITLAPRSSGAHAALAFNTFYGSRDFRRAAALFEKAVALDPANAAAHHWYALTAMQERKFGLALREIHLAQRHDPRSPSILANRGLILFHAGRVQEAIAILKPLAETAPALLSPHAYLATIYLALGRETDFLREFGKAAALSESAPQAAIARAAEAGYARGGRQAMLQVMLAEQQRQYADGREPAFRLGLTANMLGDRAAALSYLRTAQARGEGEIAGIRLEPALANLHGDAEYERIAGQVGRTVR